MTSGLPTEFDIFYKYVRGLGFEDLPDYEGCRRLFRDLARRERVGYDGVFDWSGVGERVWDRNRNRGRGRSGSAPGAAGGNGGGGGGGAGGHGAGNQAGNGNKAGNGHGVGNGSGGGKGEMGGMGTGGRKRRYCEACEAKARERQRMSISQPSTLSRRSK